MIASTPITNTEIFAFIAVLVFKLLSRKVLFINRKDSREKKSEKNDEFFASDEFFCRLFFTTILFTDD